MSKFNCISFLFIILLAPGFSVHEQFTMDDCDRNDINSQNEDLPLLINTWKFKEAAKKAWLHLTERGASAVETVERGCTVCEQEQCDFTVGYGGSPDEKGETTLDAMIMDGNTMNVGAVGGLRRVKNAVGVAKHVLENTRHSILVGELATNFARDMQFTVESLGTNESLHVWKKWKDGHCQPNFWQHVNPNPKHSCGPYEPFEHNERETRVALDDQRQLYNEVNHDTITMIVIDPKKRIAVGTSSNGANHKIPGRVGDAPIPGAGGYADASVGAAAATGDGDVMMRFLPSYLAVEEMRRGASPTEAAETAIKRIGEHYPSFFGAVIAANMKGEYGAACNGMKQFPFCVANPKLGKVTVQNISCFNSK